MTLENLLLAVRDSFDLNMKICSKCKNSKDLKEFHKNKDGEFGRHSICKICKSFYRTLKYKLNPKIELKQNKLWTKANQDKVTRIYWKYRNKVKHKYLENTARYNANKNRSTPNWLSKKHLKELKEIYKNCPKDYHVDHIVPLRGKNVSGLHVPWNLQYLPAKENMKKGNKF